jgi:hypothetical protein
LDVILILKRQDDGEVVIGVRCQDIPCMIAYEMVDVDLNFRDKNFKKKVIDDAPSKPSLSFCSNYTFNNLMSWDHQLNSWVHKIRDTHGYFPNVLLASTEIYARLDLVANARGKEKMKNSIGEGPPELEFASMSGFRGSGYEIDFCMDELVPLDSVRLIYDSDPDGVLPIPGEEEAINIKAS